MHRIRPWVVMACIVAAIPVASRGREVAAEVHRGQLATAAYHRGTVLVSERRFGEASAAFREAIAFSPREAEPYRGLAEAEFKSGRITEAVQAYRNLTAIYPFTYLSGLYWEIAILEISGGRLEDARQDLLRAVAVDPNDWRAYYFLGIVYRQLGDISGARAAWRRVIVLQPDFKQAYEQLRSLEIH